MESIGARGDVVLEERDEKKCDIVRGTFSQERLKYPFYKSLTRVTILIPGIISPSILKKLEQSGIHSEFKACTGNTLLYFNRAQFTCYPIKWITLLMVLIFALFCYFSMLLII